MGAAEMREENLLECLAGDRHSQTRSHTKAPQFRSQCLPHLNTSHRSPAMACPQIPRRVGPPHTESRHLKSGLGGSRWWQRGGERQRNRPREVGSGKRSLGEQGERVLLRVAGPPPGIQEPRLSLHQTREKVRYRAKEGCVCITKLSHKDVLLFSF